MVTTTKPEVELKNDEALVGRFGLGLLWAVVPADGAAECEKGSLPPDARLVLEVEIVRETEKARLVKVEALKRSGHHTFTTQVWLPKSQTELRGRFLLAPSWLVAAKEEEKDVTFVNGTWR